MKSHIKLAIFDMDGTVFDSKLDWIKIREELEIRQGESILNTIYGSNRVDESRLKILEDYEEWNTKSAAPINGVFHFLEILKKNDILTALVTNNNKRNSDFLLNKYKMSFDVVVTREMQMWKPDPDPLLYVMELLGIKRIETMTIGDSHYDILASRKARIKDIYIIKNEKTTGIEDGDITLFHDYFDLAGKVTTGN